MSTWDLRLPWGACRPVVLVLHTFACEVASAHTVEHGLETKDVVVHNAEILVLDGRANLHHTCTQASQLHSGLGRGDTTCSHDGEIRSACATDIGNHAASDWTVLITAHTACSDVLGAADLGPGVASGVEVHDSQDGVHDSNSGATSLLECKCTDTHVGDVGCALCENWNSLC